MQTELGHELEAIGLAIPFETFKHWQSLSEEITTRAAFLQTLYPKCTEFTLCA